MPYAIDTDVPIDRSRAQIEAMLRQRGAEGFGYAWHMTAHRIEFTWNKTHIRFELPGVNEEEYAADKQGRTRPPTVRQRMVDQATRSRWRSLYLVIKAKLEAVDAGISIFEEEFMAFVVLADGSTIGERVLPALKAGKLTLKMLQAENPK